MLLKFSTFNEKIFSKILIFGGGDPKKLKPKNRFLVIIQKVFDVEKRVITQQIRILNVFVLKKV